MYFTTAQTKSVYRTGFQLHVLVLQLLVEMIPFLQRCSQDSGFGRHCFVLLTPAQQCFRVCGQLPSEVFKCRAWVVFRVPGDLEKGGLVVDLSQQACRYKVCNELKGHACGDAQASLLEGDLVYLSISSSKEQFVWLLYWITRQQVVLAVRITVSACTKIFERCSASTLDT